MGKTELSLKEFSDSVKQGIQEKNYAKLFKLENPK